MTEYFGNEDIENGENKEDKVLIHDGTEREIPRPQDEDEQQDKYSGKKKKHTVKNLELHLLLRRYRFADKKRNYA